MAFFPGLLIPHPWRFPVPVSQPCPCPERPVFLPPPPTGDSDASVSSPVAIEITPASPQKPPRKKQGFGCYLPTIGVASPPYLTSTEERKHSMDSHVHCSSSLWAWISKMFHTQTHTQDCRLRSNQSATNNFLVPPPPPHPHKPLWGNQASVEYHV